MGEKEAKGPMAVESREQLCRPSAWHRVVNTAWHAQQMPGGEGAEQQNSAQAGKNQLCLGCDD